MRSERSEQSDGFRDRVLRAAEEALSEHQYVSVIDILSGIRLLEPVHVEAWRKGLIEFLEEMIQGSPQKISRAIEIFWDWAKAEGLKPMETHYSRNTRAGTEPLRFSRSGDAAVEKVYTLHYVSAVLPERKQEQIKEKLSRPAQPVVFEIIRDSACSECGAELESGSMLFMEGAQPLCLACARLDDLEYLGAGDAALTRRATKYSARSAVVVRFSKSRGRYERQGILVESLALERAEQECSEDAGTRAKARAVAAIQRETADRALVAQMISRLASLFPGCPPDELASIAAHTAARGSGRVGRTAAGRNLEPQALSAAVAAAVRHRHSAYDALLASGVERDIAREQVAAKVQAKLRDWRE